MKQWIAIIIVIALLPVQTVFAQSTDTEEVKIIQNVQAVATPTPTATPTSVTAPRPDGVRDILPPRIIDIEIQVTHNSAVISWKTSEPALFQLLWGKTREYEREAIRGLEFAEEHRAFISGLEPETKYHFQITAEDKAGNIGRTSDITFTTSAAPDFIPPANVSNFKAVGGDKQVTLSWKNPPDPDFAGVKIVRNTFFYPQDPLDGIPVYNGKGEFFVDTDVENGVRYYYTAFAYDYSGNFSSGAAASAVPWPVLPPEVPPTIKPPPEIMPPTAPVPPELEKLTLEDFEFWQEGRRLPIENGRLLRVKIGLPLAVVLRYEKVPETLKTIMITLERPAAKAGSDPAFAAGAGVVFSEAQASIWEELSQREFFSFILRVNPGKTQYEATLMPPDEALTYPLFVTILDFKHQVRKRLEGEMQTIPLPPPPAKPWWEEPRNWRYLIYVLLAVLLVRYLWKNYRRRKSIHMVLSRNHAERPRLQAGTPRGTTQNYEQISLQK